MIRNNISAPFDGTDASAVTVSAASTQLTAQHINAIGAHVNCDLMHGLLIATPHSQGVACDRDLTVRCEVAGVRLSNAALTRWDELTPLADIIAAQHTLPDVVFYGGVAVAVSTPLQTRDVALAAPQLFVDLYTVRPSEYDLLARELLTDLSGVINLDEPGYIPSGRIEWGAVRLADLPSSPLSSRVATRVYQPPPKDRELITPWGPGASYSYETETPYKTDPPVIVPGDIPAANDKRVHIIMNSINVYALPGNQPLAVSDIKINLDQDTFSWSINFDVLNTNSIALLQPTADGPAEFKIEINGHEWVGFVDSWTRSKTVSNDQLNQRYSVKAFSRSQFLAAPYAPKRSGSIASTTAVQAAGAELTGTGFTLNWDTQQLPDWAMPNASFSYQGLAPLQVIKRLAEAAGAVVLPGMASDTITVMPRYAVLPWDLLAADMDRTIHESQIDSASGSEQPGQLINAVMIAGEREGVALTVTRNGTAGDRPGDDVTDPWLTALEGNKSRGAQEIAASGRRISHTLDLPIPESAQTQPGLLLPGMTVAVQHDDSAQDYRAYVAAVSISAAGGGSAVVRQTVTLDQPIGWESV